MRPDAKLGLALGILVLGFALALCCPRTRESAPVAAAQPALFAEPGLEFLPIRAYQSPAPPPQVPPSQNPSAPVLEIVTQAPVSPAPEPVLPLPLPTASIARVPAMDQPAVPVSPPRSPLGEPGPNAPLQQSPRVAVNPQPPRTYRVEPGDTLSDIASRMLGGSQRYQELFEANRDKLRSPDDLRIGLELVLPSRELPHLNDQPPTIAERPDSVPTTR